MYNWDKFRRTQCNINKAIPNEAVAFLTSKYYNRLQESLVKTPEDRDVFNDTFLKLTYKYNPNKDFVEQFKWIFNQLKGAYYRDAKCNIHYQLDEERLDIPDFVEDTTTSQEPDLITNLKAMLKA